MNYRTLGGIIIPIAVIGLIIQYLLMINRFDKSIDEFGIRMKLPSTFINTVDNSDTALGYHDYFPMCFSKGVILGMDKKGNSYRLLWSRDSLSHGDMIISDGKSLLKNNYVQRLLYAIIPVQFDKVKKIDGSYKQLSNETFPYAISGISGEKHKAIWCSKAFEGINGEIYYNHTYIWYCSKTDRFIQATFETSEKSKFDNDMSYFIGWIDCHSGARTTKNSDIETLQDFSEHFEQFGFAFSHPRFVKIESYGFEKKDDPATQRAGVLLGGTKSHTISLLWFTVPISSSLGTSEDMQNMKHRVMLEVHNLSKTEQQFTSGPIDSSTPSMADRVYFEPWSYGLSDSLTHGVTAVWYCNKSERVFQFDIYSTQADAVQLSQKYLSSVRCHDYNANQGLPTNPKGVDINSHSNITTTKHRSIQWIIASVLLLLSMRNIVNRRIFHLDHVKLVLVLCAISVCLYEYIKSSQFQVGLWIVVVLWIIYNTATIGRSSTKENIGHRNHAG